MTCFGTSGRCSVSVVKSAGHMPMVISGVGSGNPQASGQCAWPLWVTVPDWVGLSLGAPSDVHGCRLWWAGLGDPQVTRRPAWEMMAVVAMSRDNLSLGCVQVHYGLDVREGRVAVSGRRLSVSGECTHFFLLSQGKPSRCVDCLFPGL